MNLNTISLPWWSRPIRELSNIFGRRIIFTRCVQETLGSDLLPHILTNKKTMVSWQMTIVNDLWDCYLCWLVSRFQVLSGSWSRSRCKFKNQTQHVDMDLELVKNWTQWFHMDLYLTLELDFDEFTWIQIGSGRVSCLNP
jgi:hypothetical protein